MADFIGTLAFHLPGGREDRDLGNHLLITNRFWSAGAPLRTFRLLLQGQVPNNREPLPLSVTVQTELVVPVRLAVRPEAVSALTAKSGSAKIFVPGGLNTSVWPARPMVKEPVPEPDST